MAKKTYVVKTSVDKPLKNFLTECKKRINGDSSLDELKVMLLGLWSIEDMIRPVKLKLDHKLASMMKRD
jgi:hypothetical protein